MLNTMPLSLPPQATFPGAFTPDDLKRVKLMVGLYDRLKSNKPLTDAKEMNRRLPADASDVARRAETQAEARPLTLFDQDVLEYLIEVLAFSSILHPHSIPTTILKELQAVRQTRLLS